MERTYLVAADDDGYLFVDKNCLIHVSFKKATQFEDSELGLRTVKTLALNTHTKVFRVTCTLQEV